MFNRRLWFAAQPFSESHLLFAPSSILEKTVQYTLKFIDPDGAQFNQAQVSVEPKAAAIFELEPFLGGLKLESGMRHGCVEISSDEASGAAMRLVSREQVSIFKEFVGIQGDASGFFPIAFSEERRTSVIISNNSDAPAVARVRLFLGNRAPDATVPVPPRGVRCLPVETTFKDVIAAPVGCGYLRVSVKAPGSIGFLLAETVDWGRDNETTLVWGGAA